MEPPAPVIDLTATLAEAIQYKTVSYDDAPPDPDEQARAFDSLHAFLRTTFPRTLGMAERIGASRAVVKGAGHEIQFTGRPLNEALMALWATAQVALGGSLGKVPVKWKES